MTQAGSHQLNETPRELADVIALKYPEPETTWINAWQAVHSGGMDFASSFETADECYRDICEGHGGRYIYRYTIMVSAGKNSTMRDTRAYNLKDEAHKWFMQG